MVVRRGTGAKRLSLMNSGPPSTVDPDRHLACDQPGQGATDRNHCEDPTLAQVHQHEDETEDDPQRYADHNGEDHLVAGHLPSGVDQRDHDETEKPAKYVAADPRL